MSPTPFIARHEPSECGFTTLGKPSFDHWRDLKAVLPSFQSHVLPHHLQLSLITLTILNRASTNNPEMPAPLPQITTPPSTITLIDLVGRQQITTISVIASSTPSGVSSGNDNSEKKPFPVAVAIPALVGGMAAAFGAFGLWWWCSKRNKKQRRVSSVYDLPSFLTVASALFARVELERCGKEADRQERWEAAQRKKQRQRANSAGRPSIASSRGPSATNLKNLAEKDIIPPVPALPKHYPTHGEKQSPASGGYGYAQQQQQPQQVQGYGHAYGADPYYQPPASDVPRAQYPHGYAPQPTIDGPISPTYSDHSANSGNSSASASTSATSTSDPSTSTKEKKTSPTKSGSRSTARVAVADSAAATAGLDASIRYQPKKPSPLALKAMEDKKKAEAARYGEQEMLAVPEQYQQGGGRGGRNVMSGEWGVALGSPNHDPSAQFSFADQQQQQSQYINEGSGKDVSRYSNDPYLAQNRVPSGHYSNDPYAGYHDPVSNAGQKSNWV